MEKKGKIMIGRILKNLINLDYSYGNMDIINMMNELDFKEVFLPKHIKKKKLDNWKNERTMNKMMTDFSYVINPCKEISLFVRILNGFYLSFVFLKGENENPVFSTNVYRDYIYVYTSRRYKPTIYFYGEDVISEEQSKYIENYHNKKQKQIIRNMNVDYQKTNTDDDFKLRFVSDLHIYTMINNKNIFFDKNKMSEKMMNVANKITQLFVIWKRKIDALDSNQLV